MSLSTPIPTFAEISKSKVEKWCSQPAEELIKNAKENKNFSLAERTVEAVTPSLMKLTEGYVSEVGDVALFLYVAYDSETKETLVSLIQDIDEYTARLVLRNEEGKELVAAFLCDFPDALFSMEGGIPLIMFMEIPGNATSITGGYLPGEKVKKYVTLNNMIEASLNKIHKLCIAIPASSKNKK